MHYYVMMVYYMVEKMDFVLGTDNDIPLEEFGIAMNLDIMTVMHLVKQMVIMMELIWELMLVHLIEVYLVH